MHMRFLVLLVISSYSSFANSASLRTIIGDVQIKGEYATALDVIETADDRWNIITQWSSLRNVKNDAGVNLKIEYYNNQLAFEYYFLTESKPVEEVKIGQWKYQFLTGRPGNPSAKGIFAWMHKVGAGTITIDVQTSDPELTNSDLVEMVKNIPLDSDRALKTYQSAKPALKTIRTSKDSISTAVGQIPMDYRLVRASTFLKQVQPSTDFSSGNGQRIAFVSSSWALGMLDNTVLESYCGTIATDDFDLDAYYKRHKYLLFQGEFTHDSKKDFIGLDSRGVIEDGTAAVDNRIGFKGPTSYQASLAKIRKGNEIYLIRIIFPSQNSKIKDDLLAGLAKTVLECKPYTYFQTEIEKD